MIPAKLHAFVNWSWYPTEVLGRASLVQSTTIILYYDPRYLVTYRCGKENSFVFTNLEDASVA